MTDGQQALPSLDPFGRGPLLRGGDLVLAHNADGLLELQFGGGVGNLAQGLGVTVETPLGSDLFNRLFGFDLYSILRGGYTLAMTKQLIRLHVTNTITADDRVLRIEELTFDDEARFAELNPGTDPVARARTRKATRRWELDVVIQPVSGAPTVVPIQVAGA
jgi:phage baseplate assembly protein W